MGTGSVLLRSEPLKICFQTTTNKKTFCHCRLSGMVEHLMKAENIDIHGPILVHI